MNTMAKFFSRFRRAQQADKTEARAVFAVGSLINGRYRLDAEIGRGGMGIVYRAHDIPNDRDVAIKVINTDKANALTREQFLREAEISARFQHPHIVAVYEIGEVESVPFIVMELVKGTSLSDMPGLTYARIIEIGIQICEALEYAHNEGFVYRDLKPGNVLVEKRGFHYFARLMDFGLARPRGTPNAVNESSVAGTLFYLAPELIAGQPADIPSDLYALGATLYEMITGRVPFSDFDEQAILSQHLEASATPPSHSRADVPPALEAIVLRLLAKDPTDRFASAQQVRQALEEIHLTHESSRPRGNLPPLSKELTGHEDDIAQVKELLQSNRLVTLLGGSESLTLATGAQLMDQFSDGVWWVDLAPLDDPGRVLETVATVLGICRDPDRSLTVSLIEHLHEKNLLLIFTACDHLLGACAQLVETILRGCPDVYILAAGQQPLNVVGERVLGDKG